jgi:hypothetical protein
MKTLSFSSILFILCTFFVSNSAHADQWVDVQGTNCVVEFPGNTTGVFYRGWGVDFTQNAANVNWVHSAIPLTLKRQARFIYVRYYKSSAAANISLIRVFNGEVVVQQIVPPVGVAGWNSIQVDLGSFMSFTNGLGVSLSTISGNDPTRFIISDVGAYYF